MAVIVLWATIIGLLSVGAIAAAHGFTAAVQSSVKNDWSPARN